MNTKRKNNILRRVAAFFASVIILLPFFSYNASAATDYVAIVNDTILPMTPSYMPQRARGLIYVPENVFRRSELGLLVFFSDSRNEANIYDGSKTLVFNLSSGVAYDYDKQYNFPAYKSDGRIYFPADFVCSYFGIQYIYWSDLNAVRIAKSPIFSMGTFRHLYESEIIALIESNSSPSSSTSAFLPASPSSPSQSPQISRFDIYLTFEGLSEEYTPQILDILDEAGVKASFFVYGEDIFTYRDIITRIFSLGHTIGLLGYARGEMTPENMIEELSLANEALDEVVFSKTRIVLFPDGSEIFIGENIDLLDHLNLSGYRLWDYSSNCKDPGRDASSPSTYLANVRNLASSLSQPSIFRFTPSPALASSLADILSYCLNSEIPIMTINDVTKPINDYDYIK